MPAMRSSLVPSAALLLLVALPAMIEGQARSGGTRDTVPLTMLPPAGKCRIWMDGVPAAQQPAPTDCSTALRQRPANGTILYGPAARETSGGRFDPSVGERAPAGTAKQRESLERGGSDAERELQRRRDKAERDRVAAEMRERDERARRDATDRARLMFGDAPRGNGATPAAAREGTGSSASPRGATKTPSEPAQKPPAEPVKKKPE